MTYSILTLIIFSMSVTILILFVKFVRRGSEIWSLKYDNQGQADTIYNLRQDIRVLITVSPEQKKEVKQRWEIRFREEHLFNHFKK